MICKECGGNVPEGKKFCPMCGIKVIELQTDGTELENEFTNVEKSTDSHTGKEVKESGLICEKCGNIVPEGKKFCPMCGMEIVALNEKKPVKDVHMTDTLNNDIYKSAEDENIEPESHSVIGGKNKKKSGFSKEQEQHLENGIIGNKSKSIDSKKKKGIIAGICAAGAAAAIIIPLVAVNAGKSNLSLEKQLESLQAKAETATSEEMVEIMKEAAEVQAKLEESVLASAAASVKTQENNSTSAVSETSIQTASTAATTTTAQTTTANVTLSQVQQSTVETEAVVVQAQPATIISRDGYLENTGQVDSYTFEAPNDGRYRAELTGMGSRERADLALYDIYGNLLESQDECKNGDGVTVKDLIGGSTYEIRVSESGSPTVYTLSVGLQKAPFDISYVTEAIDSVEYTDQRNLYNFMPQTTGDYRFELTDVSSGVLLDMFAFDDPGNKLDSIEAIGDGKGLTLKNMQAGELYEIQVRQSKGLGGYSLLIK